ncbi:AAA family ATPase [Kordia aestuariivivens]|uniref:AAA family ATPase n=1 Tax=Kordia aestuariivivens TaxID=2759037 RepID=UPI001C068271|nr:AAA family ATPase [Kordia aestuariivivens]
MNENYFDHFENGGIFYRADLHIHSHGFEDGSFDVKDPNMTPENIVDKAIDSGLSIISITDHNEINNSKKAIDYSKGKNILVIPGIEISTTQGHLLCYFPAFKDLRNFYGKLGIAENKETCNQGIVECLTLSKSYNGIGILAHIELESSGFEKAIGKFGPIMDNILNHDNLYGLEIVKIENEILYTDNDDNSDRKNLISKRRKSLDLDKNSDLAKLMSSDAHSLEKLGTNADGEKRLTRIKMDTLTFEGFKNALSLPASRIRLEKIIPESVPHFVGIQLDDGLLKDQEIKFSRNLTCIIGGRGTGKSTLLNSIQEASGNPSKAGVVDSDVWSQTINLVYEDETKKRTRFVREKKCAII